MQRSDTIGKLAEALAKAQGKIKGALKDSENPFFRSHYADLAAVWEACRESLSENGLSVIQLPQGYVDGACALETILVHSSGEWICGAMPMKPVKDDPQGWGSCITYFRRYGLAAIVGIAQVDDEGNVASGKPALNTKEAAQEVARQKIAEGLEKVKAKADEQKQQESQSGTAKPKPGEFVYEGRLSAISEVKKSPNKKIPFVELQIGEHKVNCWKRDFFTPKDDNSLPPLAALMNKDVRANITLNEQGYMSLNAIEMVGGPITDSDLDF